MPLIAADDVRAKLEGKTILQGVSFSIDAGVSVGLLGPNGSGKTTLLRTISGLIPYHGSLDLDGIPIRQWKPKNLARRLAFVRQTPSIGFDFSVTELVSLGRAPHKKPLQGFTNDDHTLIKRALATVDLEELADRSVLSLSGGELQRAFLAQALVQEADILLLDEPTSHLDVHYQFEFMNLVRDLVALGKTVITVFHDLELAARYTDYLVVLNQGRTVSTGCPENVITSELIASVFRMDAEIYKNPDGAIHIHYLSPIGLR